MAYACNTSLFDRLIKLGCRKHIYTISKHELLTSDKMIQIQVQIRATFRTITHSRQYQDLRTLLAELFCKPLLQLFLVKRGFFQLFREPVHYYIRPYSFLCASHKVRDMSRLLTLFNEFPALLVPDAQSCCNLPVLLHLPIRTSSQQ